MRLRLTAAFAFLGLSIFLPFLTSPAYAAEGDLISVVLVDSRGGGTPTPVPNVKITVTDEAGTEIGSAVTDAQGAASVPIPGAGTYNIELNKADLPPGTELTGDGGTTRTINVMISGESRVQFQIGDPPEAPPPFYERLINASVSGIKFGLIIGLAALGLSMIFGTTGLTNFAHGELITFGAIMTFVFNRGLGFPVIIAAVAAILAGALFGWAQDRGLWRPLRNRGTGLIAMMIVSIGFAITLRYSFQYAFGAETKALNQYVQQTRMTFGPIQIAEKEIVIIVISILTLALAGLGLAKTRIGKATRAVADNPALSATSGLKVNTVIAVVWTLGTAMTALAGAMMAVDQQVNFRMGYNMLLLVFAAVTLGGLGTIWGSVIGSLIIGWMVEVSPVFGVPVELKYVGPLLVLIIILLIRPQGILGRKERIG